jgi:hypothetical protein
MNNSMDFSELIFAKKIAMYPKISGSKISVGGGRPSQKKRILFLIGGMGIFIVFLLNQIPLGDKFDGSLTKTRLSILQVSLCRAYKDQKIPVNINELANNLANHEEVVDFLSEVFHLPQKDNEFVEKFILTQIIVDEWNETLVSRKVGDAGLQFISKGADRLLETEDDIVFEVKCSK